MTSSTRRIVGSKRVVLPDGETAADLWIDNGVIERIVRRGQSPPGDDDGATEGWTIHDFADAVILPGLVDTHVHLNQPGRTEWEGMVSGTAAARAGGITTLVDMPLNSSPVTTTVDQLRCKQSLAGKLSSVELWFHAGVVPESAGRVGEMIAAGAVGAKAFLCDSGIDEFPAADDQTLRVAMPILAECGAPLLVHAERTHPVPGGRTGPSYADYLASRPPSFERSAIAEMIDRCRDTGCRVHIVHVADAGSLGMIASAKAEGLPITAETCPHYLFFDADQIGEGQTQFKCAPPIRDRANADGLWRGLIEGTLDMIVSDHSPCPPSMKQTGGDFATAWGGIASLQWSLPIVWTMARRRGVDLSTVARWMSSAPATLVGLDRGIREGGMARLTVFDPDASWTANVDRWHHRHPVSPYDGGELWGRVVATITNTPDRLATGAT